MLPGLVQLVMAVTTTVVVAICGLGQLARYEAAQTDSASAPTPESRYAGLAFAERADWTPDAWSGRVSLETLAPFANLPRAVSPPKQSANLAEESVSARAAPPTLEPETGIIQVAVRLSAVPDPVAPAISGRRIVPAPAPPRIILASLPMLAADTMPAQAARVDLAQPVAAERLTVMDIAPDPLSDAAAEPLPGAQASLVEEAPVLPLSEVRLPQRRPAVMHAPKAKAKAKAAPAKRKVAHRTVRKPAQAARKPAAQAQQQQEPFGSLFGDSNYTQPRN